MTFADFSWDACVPFWAFAASDGGALVVFTGLFWWAWRDGLKQGAKLAAQATPAPERGLFLDRDATAAHDRPVHVTNR